MAILRTEARRRRASAWLLAGAIVALAGCALFEARQSARRSYAFSHKAHVELEIACTDCHLAAETADEPGMPGVGACKLCHAELDAEKPADRKVETLYEGKAFRVTARGALGAGMVFSHSKHVEAGLECASCHAGIEGNEDVIELPPASMDGCTSCHAERGVQVGCAACHPAIREDVAPPSHEAAWTKRHGSRCRGDGQGTADRCDLCHRETDCASCHATTPPENHTAAWRRVGHGITARFDRQSCATCHTPDSCRTCHSENPPRSHAGGFGSPRNQHCLGCHEPLQGEGCATCHPGTPSHALAAPKPPGHEPAMNCRQCHQPGSTQPPMPHPDDGTNCNRCHH
jgi:hypothetical protein